MGSGAEQIRAELRLQAKEMPRILKEGLGKKEAQGKGSEEGDDVFPPRRAGY